MLGVEIDQLRKEGRIREGGDVPKATLTYDKKTALLRKVETIDTHSDIIINIYYKNGELSAYQEFHQHFFGDSLQMTFHPKLQVKSFVTRVLVPTGKDNEAENLLAGWEYEFDAEGTVIKAIFHEFPKNLDPPIRLIR